VAQQDNPGVVVPPPLLYGVAFAAVLGLRWLWPLPVAASPATLWAGVALLLAGIALGLWGSVSLRRAGTNILPSQPTTAIVASGPFRFSRNPLYVGLSLDLIGLSLIVNSLWGFVVLVPVLAVMHFGVILREERYLGAKFGESYRQYCSAVRRYV
jgi:protein-S-isoprenylcysteine O-methyltransferase Ste14